MDKTAEGLYCLPVLAGRPRAFSEFQNLYEIHSFVQDT